MESRSTIAPRKDSTPETTPNTGSAAAAHGQKTAVYTLGELVVVVWRHGENPTRKPQLALDGAALAKPYMGAKVDTDTVALVAVGAAAGPRGETRLTIADENGKEVLSATVPAKPLAMLHADLPTPEDAQKLLLRIIKNGPKSLASWNTEYEAALTRLLVATGAGRSQPRASATSRMPSASTPVVYSRDNLVFVMLPHHQRSVRELSVVIDRALTSAHALRFALAEGVACVVTLVEAPLADAIPIAVIDGAGDTLFESPNARQKPLEALVKDLIDGKTAERLFTAVLERAPTEIDGWRGQHQQWVASLLHQRPVVTAPPPVTPAVETTAPMLMAVKADVDSSPLTEQSVSASGDYQARILRVDGCRITGWAYRQDSPESPVRLSFRLNGVNAGVVLADTPVTDPALPTDYPNHGFEVVLRRDALGDAYRERHELTLIDVATDAVILDRYPVSIRTDLDRRRLDEISAQLGRMEQAIGQLREQLPVIRLRESYGLADYDLWHQDIYPGIHARQAEADATLRELPRITVVLPLTPTCTLATLAAAIDSLISHPHRQHRFFVLNLGQQDQAFETLVNSYRRDNGRLMWLDATERSMAVILKLMVKVGVEGYCLFLRPGERLAADALTHVGREAAGCNAKIVYADSDTVDDADRHIDPVLRPDFSPDLLMSTPYIGAFAMELPLLDALARELEQSEDGVWQYELLLRAMPLVEPGQWRHIARVLSSQPEVLQQEPDTAVQAAITDVLRDHLVRQELDVDVSLDEALYTDNPEIVRRRDNTVMRTTWSLPEVPPKVSIIVPMRDRKDLSERCIASLRDKTDYSDYEILIVDNGSEDSETHGWLEDMVQLDGVRVLEYSGEFNWSAINNYAASHAAGDVLCFLNNDTEVLAANWLSELVSHAVRPGVGAVGAKLVFKDGTVQHAGVVVGARGGAEHAFTGLPGYSAGYQMRARVVQNVSAVTGACLVCRREVFDEFDGFNLVELGVAFNDVDFCLRLAEAGYRIVWTPHAVLFHAMGQSRGQDTSADKRARLDKEMAYMEKRWGNVMSRDPYYHPAFERFDHPYTTLSAAWYAP